MLKKSISSLLLALLFLAASPSVLAHTYSDVPEDSSYFYDIDYLRRNDVFMDSPNFYPDVVISRAEFIKYLVILNSPKYTVEPSVTLPFEDTRDNAWYAPYFKEAIRLGILSERETLAEPDKKLTLIDGLTLLFHSQSVPIPKVYKGDIPYPDVSRNQQVAPLIMQALSLGLIDPPEEVTANVGIYARVTRKEAARLIYRMDLANYAIGFGESPTAGGGANLGELSPELQKLITAWELIQADYIDRGELDSADLLDATLHAMTEALGDPYSTYLSRDEQSFFSDDLDGEIEGIGAFVGLNEEGRVIIITPIKGGPAEAAGVKSGDIILEVNGENVEEVGLQEAVRHIKGPRGTEAKLVILRDGARKEIKVIRDLVKVESLSYEIEGDVIKIGISQFNLNTAKEFREAVEIAQKNSSVKGILIDVRDNPGGLLDSVVNILGYLVKPQSEVVSIEYANFSQSQYSAGKGELFGYPIVVLINKGSASASEILAGALKDLGLATLVGEKTFGKGSVQELSYFTDGSSLKLTVAKWLTPLGHSIDGNGIEPGVKVSNPEGGTTDAQMNRAMQALRSLINAR